MTIAIKCSECKQKMNYINHGRPGENYLYQCPNCKKIRGINYSVYHAVRTNRQDDLPYNVPDFNSYCNKAGVIITNGENCHKYSQKKLDEPL